VEFGSADSRQAREPRTAIERPGMCLWFLYALLGGKSAGRGLAIVFAALAFFFYCFVHEAFDSPPAKHSAGSLRSETDQARPPAVKLETGSSLVVCWRNC